MAIPAFIAARQYTPPPVRNPPDWGHGVFSLNFAPPLGHEAAPLPDWLLLVPSGVFRGVDGRTFRNRHPQAVCDTFAREGRQLPVDLEHSTHLAAPLGQPAPAAGWIDRLEVRDAEVWGHVEWNASGAEALRSRAYRYYSPAYFTRDEVVIAIPSVGLTNRPNLPDLPALNQSESLPMDLTEICTALGLDSSADLAAILAAISDLKDKVAANAPPALNAYIPRADYDLLVGRVAAAEAQAQAIARAQHNKAVDLALNSALVAGKITPATESYYRGQCTTPEGLAAFQAFVNAAPAVVNTGPAVSGAKSGGTIVALNAQQREIARALGLDEAAYLKTLQADLEVQA